MSYDKRWAARRAERLQAEAREHKTGRVEVRIRTAQGHQMISVTAWREGGLQRYRWRINGAMVITKADAIERMRISFELQEAGQ